MIMCQVTGALKLKYIKNIKSITKNNPVAISNNNNNNNNIMFITYIYIIYVRHINYIVFYRVTSYTRVCSN